MRDDRNTNLQEAYPSYAVELVSLIIINTEKEYNLL